MIRWREFDPRMSSPLLLLSACRDGGEPPFSRPGGWEDGRRRQPWRATYVRSAGKARERESSLLTTYWSEPLYHRDD